MTDDHRRKDDHLVEPLFTALGDDEAAEVRVSNHVGLVVGIVILVVVVLVLLDQYHMWRFSKTFHVF